MGLYGTPARQLVNTLRNKKKRSAAPSSDKVFEETA